MRAGIGLGQPVVAGDQAFEQGTARLKDRLFAARRAEQIGKGGHENRAGGHIDGTVDGPVESLQCVHSAAIA